jgi:hypothetical protein
VQFSYADCMYGCDVTKTPLAANGATETVQLMSGPNFTTVKSTDESVVKFVAAGRTITATTVSAGSADLQLMDAQGNLIDAVTVTVKAVSAITYFIQGSQILEAAVETLAVTPKDASGIELLGAGALQFALKGTLVEDPGSSTPSNAITFHGRAGAGEVVISAGNGVKESVPFQIVPASAVTAISATAGTGFSSNSRWAIPVTVSPSTANGAVYGACAWSTSDPSVTVDSNQVSSLNVTPGSHVYFLLARSGTFTANCSIGTATANVTLQR